MPYLILSKYSANYKVIPLTGALTIGRSTANDIVLSEPDDTNISRTHAKIEKRSDGFYLCDNSSNGTYVNGLKIKEWRFEDTHLCRIGKYSLLFMADAFNTAAHADETSLQELTDDETVFESSTAFTLKKDLRAKLNSLSIVSNTPAMFSLFKDIEEIAKVNVPVLILGEPGTGKEKVAQALHHFSEVKGNFIPLNCSAIPEGIFESELFGSLKGAFSQAVDKPGKLETADNGSLFLDEIGEMHLSLQPRILRFLEDKQITRLGDTRSKKINVRIIAATNSDLTEMLEAGTFRADLYQRLACIKLQIPPLRRRREDILPLAEYFLHQFAQEHSLAVKELATASQKMLLAYPWPGNVRELRNVLLNAAVRGKSKTILPSDLAIASEELKEFESNAESESGFLSLKESEKVHIQKALEKANGNKAQTAKLLGISRDTLYKKMEKYNLT